ncbi:MAG TPA: gluconate 2-dehydrogenase subunit 3 family protein [Gemmatimonadaceae bacterium]|nr:gluconate 2-dehydrogenase subunit 3 family protein [Gemmatimonadaceae bacterium]
MANDEQDDAAGGREPAMTIDRREAIRRVTALLGGIALVGGDALLTGCRDRSSPLGRDAKFTAADVAFLDEVADTILPATATPGAKAAKVGAFMALMVTDTYDARDQQAFRDGMRTLDEASTREHDVPFVQATPQQRLALLQRLDREQKADADARAAARTARAGRATPADTAAAGDKHLPDERSRSAAGGEEGGAEAITKEPPAHYFRMMKELALLGYFTSEIGYTQAMRYVESPGRFDPCVPYTPGERLWAPHA